MDTGAASHIRVYARVRPAARGSPRACVTADERAGTITLASADGSSPTNVFTFDATGGPDTTQQEVFDVVGRGVVDAVLAGFNAAVFAYGQTASGKSHTMLGACLGRARNGIRELCASLVRNSSHHHAHSPNQHHRPHGRVGGGGRARPPPARD